MIVGDFPCCGGSLLIPISDGDLPRFQKQTCPHCGATVWHRHSRSDPQSWTEEAFLAEFKVDEANRQIRPKITPADAQTR